jgi:hypothetical protein
LRFNGFILRAPDYSAAVRIAPVSISSHKALRAALADYANGKDPSRAPQE